MRIAAPFRVNASAGDWHAVHINPWHLSPKISRAAAHLPLTPAPWQLSLKINRAVDCQYLGAHRILVLVINGGPSGGTPTNQLVIPYL